MGRGGMMPERVDAATIQPWLRPENARAYEAALGWLLPRCRTDEERGLAPALLLALAPLNALVAPCRPVEGSAVNFQVTLSREVTGGPERVRVTVRAGTSARDAEIVVTTHDAAPEIWLDSTRILSHPLCGVAEVLEALIPREDARLISGERRKSVVEAESDITSA